MTYELQGVTVLLAVLAMLATLVKHERRLTRWLLKSPRRRRSAFRRPVLG
jgi:hypothetical protein